MQSLLADTPHSPDIDALGAFRELTDGFISCAVAQPEPDPENLYIYRRREVSLILKRRYLVVGLETRVESAYTLRPTRHERVVKRCRTLEDALKTCFLASQGVFGLNVTPVDPDNLGVLDTGHDGDQRDFILLAREGRNRDFTMIEFQVVPAVAGSFKAVLDGMRRNHLEDLRRNYSTDLNVKDRLEPTY